MNEKILNNNTLVSLAQRAAPQVLHAIKNASTRTGVNFAYLMEQAAAESNFNEKAQSRSSSAAGLYQFIEKTWLGMVKKHGDKYGLGDLAGQINDKGQVTDTATRQKILDLRKDPEKAALLAAEFAAENKNYLAQHVGGDIGATELYFAHFMGASGASGFLNAMKENPLQTAADLFPKAARANYNVFYDRKTGQARSLAGVYEFFDKKFSGSKDSIEENIIKNNIKGEEIVPLKSSPNPMPLTDFLTGARLEHPFLRQSPSENPAQKEFSTWQGQSLFRRGALLFNPAELMLLAQGTLPTDRIQGKR